jgi:hypothetical protein
VEITDKSTIKDLRKFLKKEFAIEARFTRRGRPADATEYILGISGTAKKEKKGTRGGFVVDSATDASDLIEKIRQAAGIDLELRNGEGIKVSGRQAIGEARQLAASPFADSRTLDASIRTALNVSGDANYADTDWVRRIFDKAAFTAKTPADRKRLIEAAIGIAETTPTLPLGTVLSLLRVVCRDREDFAVAHALAADSRAGEALASRIKELAIDRLGLEEGANFP